MKTKLSFTECLKDSPQFRQTLQTAEKDLDNLEYKLDKVVKACNVMVAAGEAFNNSNLLFIKELKNLSQYYTEEDLVPNTLQRLTRVLTEANGFHVSLLDQANRSISHRLSAFINNDIQKIKIARKEFQTITTEYDNTFNKHAQVPRSRPLDCTDLDLNLASIRSTFNYTSLDYVYQINCMHSSKRFEILDTILAYINAQNTYNHQGRDLFEEIENFMKNVFLQLNELSKENDTNKDELESWLLITHSKDTKVKKTLTWIRTSSGIEIEGYLYKRTSNAFKSWVRRWFTITNNQLIYCKRDQNDENLTPSIMEPDLRFCTVRSIGPKYHSKDMDRRWCFEVLSPTRTHVLQASSEQSCLEWQRVITQSIASAYNRSELTNHSQTGIEIQRDLHIANEAREKRGHRRNRSDCSKRFVTVSPVDISNTSTSVSPEHSILSIEGNARCCDCGATQPKWASSNLGITLCIVCSGIHRSLGVHNSKVRSITLDTWPPHLIKVMSALGNIICNRIFEANVNGFERASIHSNSEIREAWIKAKYIQKRFVSPLTDEIPVIDGTPAFDVSDWYRKRHDIDLDSSTTSSITSNDLSSFAAGDTGRQSPDGVSINDSGYGVSAVIKEVLTADVSPPPTPPRTVITTPLNVDSSPPISPKPKPTSKPCRAITVKPAIQPPRTEVSDQLESSDKCNNNKHDTSTEERPVEVTMRLTPDLLLKYALQQNNIPTMLEALALGAEMNAAKGTREYIPLILAVHTNTMLCVEFLLLNGVSVEYRDDRGQTALHHATSLGNTGQVCQLLKRNADQSIIDHAGHDALQLALDAENGDIVTLLRLHKLNKEELFGQGDDTYNAVFKEFSDIASSNQNSRSKSS